jgi:TPR repeat protein
LQKAAEAGVPRAQLQLGRLYLDGEGVKQDPAEALKWFRQSASQDNEAAQFFLGIMMQRGIGGPRDLESSTAWLRRAAEHGHPLAMLELAKAYDLGLGIPADHEVAKSWRDRATKKPEGGEKKSDGAPSQRSESRSPKR